MLTEEYSQRAIKASAIVRQRDFAQPWYIARCLELAETPRFHRKQWEYAVIAQVYHERIAAGGRVLGFAVGQEPLPAFFAARGAQVLATDQATHQAGGWATSGQHANGRDALRYEGICTPEDLRTQVRFREVDMRAIPTDLTGFDFVYSSCAFEHLGSIAAGLQFLVDQVRCLAPGGVFIHTTEFRCGGAPGTLDHAGTVLFTEAHLRLGMAVLREKYSCNILPLDLASGEDAWDTYVDHPPYQQDGHLKLQIGNWVSTSVALIGGRGHAQ